MKSKHEQGKACCLYCLSYSFDLIDIWAGNGHLHIFPLPRKVKREHHQRLALPPKVTRQYHQTLHLQPKVTRQHHQMRCCMCLPRKVTLPLATLLWDTRLYSGLLSPTRLYSLLCSALLYSALFCSALSYSIHLYSTLFWAILPFMINTSHIANHSTYNILCDTFDMFEGWNQNIRNMSTMKPAASHVCLQRLCQEGFVPRIEPCSTCKTRSERHMLTCYDMLIFWRKSEAWNACTLPCSKAE